MPVTLEGSVLRRYRDGAKVAFETLIDPEEHVCGFASVGDQEQGVANARQEFCGHYLDLCATYWRLDGLEATRMNLLSNPDCNSSSRCLRRYGMIETVERHGRLTWKNRAPSSTVYRITP